MLNYTKRRNLLEEALNFHANKEVGFFFWLLLTCLTFIHIAEGETSGWIFWGGLAASFFFLISWRWNARKLLEKRRELIRDNEDISHVKRVAKIMSRGDGHKPVDLAYLITKINPEDTNE